MNRNYRGAPTATAAEDTLRECKQPSPGTVTQAPGTSATLGDWTVTVHSVRCFTEFDAGGVRVGVTSLEYSFVLASVTIRNEGERKANPPAMEFRCSQSHRAGPDRPIGPNSFEFDIAVKPGEEKTADVAFRQPWEATCEDGMIVAMAAGEEAAWRFQ